MASSTKASSGHLKLPKFSFILEKKIKMCYKHKERGIEAAAWAVKAANSIGRTQYQLNNWNFVVFFRFLKEIVGGDDSNKFFNGLQSLPHMFCLYSLIRSYLPPIFIWWQYIVIRFACPSSKFFIMSTEFDKNISDWSYDCTDHKNDIDFFMRLVKWPKIAVKKSQIL